MAVCVCVWMGVCGWAVCVCVDGCVWMGGLGVWMGVYGWAVWVGVDGGVDGWWGVLGNV